jgi:hypothetical protein
MDSIKIKDFWEIMCKKLGYNLYLGVPVARLKLVFDTMSSDKLHYIPTINETMAVGMASGAYLSGVKSAVIMTAQAFGLLEYSINKFNQLYNIPFLFIVDGDFNPLKLKQFKINKGLSVLEEMDNYMHTEEFKPSILVIGQGDLT